MCGFRFQKKIRDGHFFVKHLVETNTSFSIFRTNRETLKMLMTAITGQSMGNLKVCLQKRD
jgi:hypothetical protein